MTSSIDLLIGLAQAVAAVFEACGVAYYASRPLTDLLLGQSNSTDNLVLVAALEPSHSEALVQGLTAAFHAESTDIMQTARGQLGGFGLVHPQHPQIIEVWLSRDDAFSKAKMARRLRYSTVDQEPIWLCSAEDAILDKVLEQSGRSGQRWQGLLELLKAQSAYLDYAYLGEWANWLGVSQILSWALIEAEI